MDNTICISCNFHITKYSSFDLFATIEKYKNNSYLCSCIKAGGGLTSLLCPKIGEI